MRYGFRIDKDGRIYRDNEIIPGAERLIAKLRDEDIPSFLLLTSHSRGTRRTIRLQRRVTNSQE